MFKKIIYSLIAILIILQFFRIDKTNPAINSADDFITIEKPSKEIASLLKSSCYDCHSNESSYPWYSNIAPISWWVKHHIDEGREELNFSKWSTYDEKKKDHKLEEIIEEVEEGEMPLKPYPVTHPEAQLTNEQKEALIGWVKKTRQLAKDKKNKLTLRLNNGLKWEADSATHKAIANMVKISTKELDRRNVSGYQEMGKNLSAEMKGLFKVCKMKGEAHDQLHNYILPLVKMFRELEHVEDEKTGFLQQKKITTYLNNYTTYFE